MVWPGKFSRGVPVTKTGTEDEEPDPGNKGANPEKLKERYHD